MGYSGEGFVNSRTGAYVSPERAHQHVGESFRGFEKAKSRTTGNFYMREDDGGSCSSCGADDDFSAIITSYAGILSRDGRSGQE